MLLLRVNVLTDNGNPRFRAIRGEACMVPSRANCADNEASWCRYHRATVGLCPTLLLLVAGAAGSRLKSEAGFLKEGGGGNPQN